MNVLVLTLLLLAPPADNDRAYALGKNIRCPVCQGMPIAESPAQMAQDMMKEVQTMVKDGKSDEDIEKYFTSRYGEWVLLNPKPKGFNLLIWLLPPVFLLFGIIFILRYVRKR